MESLSQSVELTQIAHLWPAAPMLSLWSESPTCFSRSLLTISWNSTQLVEDTIVYTTICHLLKLSKKQQHRVETSIFAFLKHTSSALSIQISEFSVQQYSWLSVFSIISVRWHEASSYIVHKISVVDIKWIQWINYAFSTYCVEVMWKIGTWFWPHTTSCRVINKAAVAMWWSQQL